MKKRKGKKNYDDDYDRSDDRRSRDRNFLWKWLREYLYNNNSYPAKNKEIKKYIYIYILWLLIWSLLMIIIKNKERKMRGVKNIFAITLRPFFYMGNSLHCNQVLGLVNSVLVISGNYSLMIERHKESIKLVLTFWTKIY